MRDKDVGVRKKQDKCNIMEKEVIEEGEQVWQRDHVQVVNVVVIMMMMDLMMTMNHQMNLKL